MPNPLKYKKSDYIFQIQHIKNDIIEHNVTNHVTMDNTTIKGGVSSIIQRNIHNINISNAIQITNTVREIFIHFLIC